MLIRFVFWVFVNLLSLDVASNLAAASAGRLGCCVSRCLASTWQVVTLIVERAAGHDGLLATCVLLIPFTGS